MATVLTMPREDALEIRSALLAGIISAPERHVVEINRAIGLLDFHLGTDSQLARLRRREQQDALILADPAIGVSDHRGSKEDQ